MLPSLVTYNLSLEGIFHLFNIVSNFLTSNGKVSNARYFKSIGVCILAVIDFLS